MNHETQITKTARIEDSYGEEVAVEAAPYLRRVYLSVEDAYVSPVPSTASLTIDQAQRVVVALQRAIAEVLA